ncbi:MAG: sugar phosphate isomerase/epimerase [Bacteroidia bacterium]|nr:sugar phosphate isomerase/epimerase [Bacteroidia bacterium]
MTLSRRKFVITSLTAGAALPLAGLSKPLTTLFNNNGYVEKIGIQLYTVRDQLQKDFAGTIKAIQQAGYKQLEAMDTAQMPQLLPLAKDLGMTVPSSFFRWSYLTGRWDVAAAAGMPTPEDKSIDSVIEQAQKDGLKYLVFGYMLPQERSTLDDYKQISQKLNECGEKCQPAGIKLCYHNHSFEFGPIDGQIPYEILMAELDPNLVQFELDIFWASLGGMDPVKLMKRLKGKVRLLHLKDKLAGAPVTYNEGEVKPEAFKELGNGVVDLKK